MISRQIIMAHGLDVMECLLLRHLSPDAIEAINLVVKYGPELNYLIGLRDTKRAEKNLLSGRFGAATPAERVELRNQSKALSDHINLLDSDIKVLETLVTDNCARIPNIPSPDVPIPQEDEAWKRTLLRRVHRLIREDSLI